MTDDQAPGPPRCYFCGKRFPEADARKTEYAVGPGQRIRVLICPACDAQKRRGEGPFASSGANVLLGFLSFLGFAAVVAVVFFQFIRPRLEEHDRHREEIRKHNDPFFQRNGFGR